MAKSPLGQGVNILHYFLLLLAVAMPLLAKPHPDPIAAADSITEADLVSEPARLMARKPCVPAGCFMAPPSSEAYTGPGDYCGFCTQVTRIKNPTHLYQLRLGWDVDCCDYGVDNLCTAEWNRTHRYRKCANTPRGF